MQIMKILKAYAITQYNAYDNNNWYIIWYDNCLAMSS